MCHLVAGQGAESGLLEVGRDVRGHASACSHGFVAVHEARMLDVVLARHRRRVLGGGRFRSVLFFRQAHLDEPLRAKLTGVTRASLVRIMQVKRDGLNVVEDF